MQSVQGYVIDGWIEMGFSTFEKKTMKVGSNIYTFVNWEFGGVLSFDFTQTRQSSF